MKDALRAVGLHKTYGKKKVVDNVSIEVRKGEVVGLLGPNGAGKTTTFSMVLGLVPQDSGRIFLDDEDITGLPMYLRARKGLCLLPQEPSAFRKLSVEDNLLAIMETMPETYPRGDGVLARTLKEFGLDKLAGVQGLHPFGRRAPAARDRPGDDHRSRVHPPRRAVHGDRSPGHPRPAGDRPATSRRGASGSSSPTTASGRRSRSRTGPISSTRAGSSRRGRRRRSWPPRTSGRATWARISGFEERGGLTVLKQRLDQRQVQKLILAPALQQAIKLLPLTNLELIEVIDEELAENPMMEIEEEAETGPRRAAAEQASEDVEPEAGEPEKAPEEPAKRRLPTRRSSSASPEVPGRGREGRCRGRASRITWTTASGRISAEKREAVSLENTLSRSPSLWDHLNWQASLTFFEPEDREIAQFIIGNINDDGYLGSPVEEIARLARTAPGKGRGRPGRGSRPSTPSASPVSTCGRPSSPRWITSRSRTRSPGRSSTGTSRSSSSPTMSSWPASWTSLWRTSKSHIEIIRGLDPAPGRKYAEEKTDLRRPRHHRHQGRGRLEGRRSTTKACPGSGSSSYYKQLLAKAVQDQPEASRFLKDRLKKALWFMRSLDQRNRTIYRVARFIVDRQKDFFDKGLEFIQPLTLIEIAQEIGVHESTVGRVVANKYMETPRGVFSLKYFFHKSLHGDLGEDVSSSEDQGQDPEARRAGGPEQSVERHRDR